ncbi:hypothetical protein [Methanobrevibacter sp.]|uniref:hypothetical protein n=1 Tax=Methanobrevibacter sp. TaxID=66852 RepID=UPI00386D73AC
MIEIELKSFEEFERLNLPGVGTIFAQLEKRYPKIVEDTITEIKERCDMENIGYNSIFDIVSWAELVEYVDENIPEEILINYYVRDSCGTDRGTQYFLVANGYQFVDA